MHNGTKRDLVRQGANVAGAVFQALAGVFFVLNLSTEPVAGEGGSALCEFREL